MKPILSIQTVRSLLVIGLLLAVACASEDKSTNPESDTRAPEAISSLRVATVGDREVRLTWSATGDDGVAGQATVYDIRFLDSDLDGSSWEDATSVVKPPTPRSSGISETAVVSGLARGTWSFALKAGDEIPNWSPLSNVVHIAVGDSVPPAAVADLFASAVVGSDISLDWTATGDDGLEGQAEEYDRRYALQSITAETWEEATSVAGLTPPKTAGSGESATVSLPLGSTYFFALRVRDDGMNWSELSNVPSVSTSVVDEEAPAAVLGLAAETTTGRTVTLQWIAPGDDGDSGQPSVYDVRYSEVEITETTWSTSTQVEGLSPPSRAGAVETMTITGLEPRSVYYVALRSADEIPNWSETSNILTIETGSSWPLLTGIDDEDSYASPSWSPDGTRLVFTASFSGERGLYISTADGLNLVRIANDAVNPVSPTWSRQGDRVAFVAGEVIPSSALFTIGLEPGSEPVPIVDERSQYGRPAWSPDGSQIAYQTEVFFSAWQRVDIMVVSSVGGDPEVLLEGGSDWGNLYPSWSPDGERMAIGSTRGSEIVHFTQLFVVEMATKSTSLVVRGSPRARLQHPTWSPNGKELIYDSNLSGTEKLYRVSVSGGVPEQITFDGGSDRDPVWSPLGDRIAFTRRVDDRNEVWIQLLD